MTKPINPYKPIVDRKFIIEQAENNNMSVCEFLKGFVDDDVSVKMDQHKQIKTSLTEHIIGDMVNKILEKE